MSFTKAKKPSTLPSSSPTSSLLSPSSATPGTPTTNLTQQQLQNIKPYLNNQSLVSYGNKDLDDIMHGGHLVGTTTLLSSDSYTNYANILLLYELNEAIIHQHKILLITSSRLEALELINALPMNLNKNINFQKNPEKKAAAEDSTENTSAEEKMKLLKNAWQYGKYIKDPPSSTNANSYCSSYDLSQRLQPEILEGNYPRVFCPFPEDETNLFDPESDSPATPPTLATFLRSILTAVASFQRIYATTNQPIRIFFHRFAGITSRGFNLNEISMKRIFNQFALHLKQLISRPSPHLGVPQSTLTITIQNDLQRSGFYRIIETILADTHLTLDSFAGKSESIPIEYRYFCGFLHIHKIQQLGSLVSHRPSAAKYGLKRDRRKLHIEPLHLPPEESRASKYHPEAGNAPPSNPSAVVPTKSIPMEPSLSSSSSSSTTTATSTGSVRRIGGSGVVGHSNRQENKPKLGSMCSSQPGSHLDF